MNDPKNDLHNVQLELRNSLTIILKLETSDDTNSYRFAPAQALKNSLDKYFNTTNPNKIDFIELVKAIGAMQPYIKNGGELVDIVRIKKNIDLIATQAYQMSPIDWEQVSSNLKISSGFQFARKGHDEELINWLNSLSGKYFDAFNDAEKTRFLINCCGDPKYVGFTPKLKAYLEKHPKFLFNLAMNSVENFTNIAQSRLSLYLDDIEMVQLMEQHSEHWVNENAIPFEQIEQLVNKMSSILSYGRTFNRLMENPKVLEFLDGKTFLHLYQSPDYKNYHEEKEYKSMGPG